MTTAQKLRSLAETYKGQPAYSQVVRVINEAADQLDTYTSMDTTKLRVDSLIKQAADSHNAADAANFAQAALHAATAAVMMASAAGKYGTT